MTKRQSLLAILFSAALLFFLLRLAFLQLLPSSWSSYIIAPASPEKVTAWKRTAAVQRQQSIMLDSGRGSFFDRFGLPLTGERYEALAFFPSIIKSWNENEKQKKRELAKLLKVEEVLLEQYMIGLKEPAFWTGAASDDRMGLPVPFNDTSAAAIAELDLKGVRIVPYTSRPISNMEPKHIIGYVSEHPEWLLEHKKSALSSGTYHIHDAVGGAGLERSLESLIHGIGATWASYYTDATNNPLQGLDLRIKEPANPYYPLQVITTIDLELQQRLEKYADQAGLKKGAIVLLDAANADIRAMVSRPHMPVRLSAATSSGQTNYALKASVPGSIFKLVTAAAALEAKLVNRNEIFHCNGTYGKYKLSCWKEGGHGDITLEEGLAQSCNIVFATLAERVGAEKLEQMAHLLGVAEPIGWQQQGTRSVVPYGLRLLPEEERGRVFINEQIKTDNGALAQSGIGQRDTLMSPLQAANLMVTLLHSGKILEPRSVISINYADGSLMADFPVQQSRTYKYRIMPSTANLLLDGMKAVVERGTGKGASGGRWELAGKSGTAQITVKGEERVNQWFAGYGPVAKPRYTAAVLAAERPTYTSNQATRLFRGALDIAAQLELEREIGVEKSNK